MKLTTCILIILSFLLSGCSDSKYDGLTAQQWADEFDEIEYKYRSLKNCIQENSESYKSAQDLAYYCSN